MASEYIGVNGVARKVPTHYIGVDGVARNVKSGYVGVDGVARLFFAPESGGAVILEVEKVVSDTYANETAYTAEEFILLDIYPKTNGTVKVTYGGLTKTITDTSGAAEPNAQQVFFGTFNGVSDSVATPASGELVIEGEFVAFGCGTYSKNSKGLPSTCACVTALIDFGAVETIPTSAFSGCTGLTNVDIPDSVTTIGSSAFSGCTGLTNVDIPDSVTTIGSAAFGNCTGLTNVDIPDSVTTIGSAAFEGCFNLNFSDNFLKRGLVSIGDWAFSMTQGDDSLLEKFDSITIPETVTTIGERAFEGPIIEAYTRNLFKRVVVLPTTPPTGLGTAYQCFGKVYSNFTIVVPKGCGAAYRVAEGWSEYANYIVEAS